MSGYLTIRASGEDRARWSESAKAAGLSLSAWVRTRLDGVGTAGNVPTAKPEEPWAPLVKGEAGVILSPQKPAPGVLKPPAGPRMVVDEMGVRVMDVAAHEDVAYDDRVLEPDEAFVKNPHYRPVPGRGRPTKPKASGGVGGGAVEGVGGEEGAGGCWRWRREPRVRATPVLRRSTRRLP